MKNQDKNNNSLNYCFAANKKNWQKNFFENFHFLTFVIYHIFIPKIYAEFLVVSRRLSRFIRGLTGIIARINFGFQGESFKSFSNDNFFFSLFEYCSFSSFQSISFWLAFFNRSATKIHQFSVCHSILWLVFQDLSCYVINTMINNTFNLLMLLLAALKYPSIEELTWSHLFELKQKVSIRARRSFLAGAG